MHKVTFSHNAAFGTGKKTNAPVTVSPIAAIDIHGLNFEPLRPMRTESMIPPIIGSFTPSQTFVTMIITAQMAPGIPIYWV